MHYHIGSSAEAASTRGISLQNLTLVGNYRSSCPYFPESSSENLRINGKGREMVSTY